MITSCLNTDGYQYSVTASPSVQSVDVGRNSAFQQRRNERTTIAIAGQIRDDFAHESSKTREDQELKNGIRQHSQNLALSKLARSNALGSTDSSAFLKEVTEVASRTLEVERSSVWIYTAENKKIRCVDLYQLNTGEHVEGFELAEAEYPSYFEALRIQRAIAADDARRDPRTSEFSQSYLAPLGITSMLDAPIQVGGRMIGVICLEHIGPCRHWSLEEESFAASLADLIALSMEVNERRRANEALRDSEERYRTLAENFPHGTVILFDHDLRYIVANGLGLKEIGLSREMMEGKTIWEVLPAETCEVLEPHYQAVLKGETRLFEIDYAGKTFEVHALPIRKGPGAVQAGMVMAHDITERKRAQSLLEEYNRTLENQVRERTRELQEKQAQLIQSEKMAALGNLVAGIVHEINSPLGALNSNNDMVIRLARRIKRVVRNLDRTSQNEANSILCSAMEQIEELENVSQSATERIMKIVSSLRSFAGLDQAAVDQVEIHDGLESTITLLQHELDGRITIYKDFAAIPPIRCSPSQLNQAFMNILLNAIQAIEGVGQILVRTAKVGEWAVIEFVDSGRGIAENDLARIFDPGFTTKGVKVGTGLGLAIVHRIIEEHGGRIEVESEVGKGSTFRIMLPLQEFPHNQVLSNQNP